MSLRSDFDKTIDQSNVNVFYWTLIIKINYPHSSGGPKGPPKELEVGGHMPPYLLVIYIECSSSIV